MVLPVVEVLRRGLGVGCVKGVKGGYKTVYGTSGKIDS